MAAELQPIWRQILSDEGRKKFGLKSGPSIPFLIGVYHYHGKLSDKDLESKICLQKVFSEILSSKHKVSITYCRDLGVEVIRNSTHQNHMPITSDNISGVIDRLWGAYGKYIQGHRFSCDKVDNSWREFDLIKEISVIKTIKI